MKDNRAFTLVEIIAVIIILGIILTIAIPSVTNNIIKSKKAVYIKNVNSYMETVNGLYLEEEYGDYLEDNEILIVPLKAIELDQSEKILESPFASYDFYRSYIIIIKSKRSFESYALVRDDANYGINSTEFKDLNIKSVIRVSKDSIQDIKNLYKCVNGDIVLNENKFIIFSGKSYYPVDYILNSNSCSNDTMPVIRLKNGEEDLPEGLTEDLKYTIRYDANGGSGNMEDTICTYGETCILRENTFTYTDHTFLYWTLRKNGVGKNYDDMEDVTKNDSLINMTLYANWEEDTGDPSGGDTPDNPDCTPNSVWNLSFSGEVNEYNFPCNAGLYRIELYGAQGGHNKPKNGAKGAYIFAYGYFSKNEKVYFNIGSQEGYNGGGIGYDSRKRNNGGGATDMRLNSDSLNSRILVAGGGGGSDHAGYFCDLIGGEPYTTPCGHGTPGGGGLVKGVNSTAGFEAHCWNTGENSEIRHYTTNRVAGAKGGSQVEGGDGGGDGSFGQGGSTTGSGPGAGGGGYFGGGSGRRASGKTGSDHVTVGASNCGAGGSSYISGMPGYIAVSSATEVSPRSNSNGVTCTDEIANSDRSCSIHYSGKRFITGGGYASNNIGNGKVKITYLPDDLHKAIYNLKGGVNNGANLELISELHDNITLQNPTKTNNEFTGWSGYSDIVDSKEIINGEYILSETSKIFDKEFAIKSGKKYRIFFEAKKESASSYLTGGFYYNKSNKNSVEFRKIDTLADGYNQYYADVSIGYKKAKFYVTKQEGDTSTWNIKNVHIIYIQDNYMPVIASGITEDIHLEANWAEPHTITYNLNGGVNNVDNPSMFNVLSNKITIKDPTKTNSIFIGWTGSNEVVDSNTLINGERLVTGLEIKDEKIVPLKKGSTYRIFFEAKRLSGNSTLYFGLYYNKTIKSSNIKKINDSSDGYSRYFIDVVAPNANSQLYFKMDDDTTSWKLKNMHIIFFGSKHEPTIEKRSNDDRYYEANWADPYTITYDLQGGTPNATANPTTYTAFTSKITLRNPSLKKHSFEGWISPSITEYLDEELIDNRQTEYQLGEPFTVKPSTDYRIYLDGIKNGKSNISVGIISSDGEIKKVAVAKCENADENGYSRYYVDLTTSAKMNLVTLYVSIPNNTSYWNIKNIRLVQRLDKTIPQYSNGDRLYIASWKIS